MEYVYSYSKWINNSCDLSTQIDGISVKRYNGRRVQISVPNCADVTLVMWVMCRNGSVEDPVTWVESISMSTSLDL